MPFRTGEPSRERREQLAAFQKTLSFRFKDQALLNQALTHRSHVNEDAHSRGNNERLEFLGDAILGMVVAAYLFSKLGDKAEGDLARIKSFVVSEDTLSGIAAGIGIDMLILFGKGEERSGGRGKKAILADAMEAVFGAAYLDGGFDKARDLILRFLTPEVAKVLEDRHHKDYKTLLQEYAQKRLKTYPVYALAGKSGPDHDRTYRITCSLKGTAWGPASGKTKKEAEQSAAALAYDSIIEAGGIEAEELLGIKKL
ncbi:MAG: ribonuclease III [Spirochaetales bacterium]|nr:MAG: ribonuclease III [Spirochaetales bacterium]